MTTAASELTETGSTVLRAAWRPEHLEALRTAIEAFIALRAEHIAKGALAPVHQRLQDLGAGFGSTLLRTGFLKLDLLRSMFAGSAYQQLCRDYFDDTEFYVQASRLGFRAHDPQGAGGTIVPWHQDSGTQNPRIARLLNCWIPLAAGAGRDCPGLEVVRALAPPNFPVQAQGRDPEMSYESIAIDPERVVATFGEDKLWAPEFELGDSMVFSQDVIHRTHVTAAMTRPRIGFEFRVFSPRALAAGCSLEDLGEGIERIG